jgi:hypothetical protein
MGQEWYGEKGTQLYSSRYKIVELNPAVDDQEFEVPKTLPVKVASSPESELEMLAADAQAVLKK